MAGNEIGMDDDSGAAGRAVLLIPAVAGEVYTWTDADGNIHITDRPPADNAHGRTGNPLFQPDSDSAATRSSATAGQRGQATG
jgi:hypothetical protein